MIIKSDTIKELAGAILRAQRSMGNASKGADNPYFKSKYADLNAIREVAIPALNVEGVSVLQPMVALEGKNYVATTLLHESGEYLTSLTEVVAKDMSDPQKVGAGISYARRYALQAFLNIGAEDDDGETAAGRGNSRPAAAPAKPVLAAVKAAPVGATYVVSQARAAVAAKKISEAAIKEMISAGDKSLQQAISGLSSEGLEGLSKHLKGVMNGK